MKSQEAVAKRLLVLLKLKKMSRYALSKKVGISESTLYNIVKGNCDSVNLDTIYLISLGLDMTIQEFFADRIFKYENIDIE